MRSIAIALGVFIGVLGGFYGGFHYGQSRPAAASTTSVAATTTSAATGGATSGATGGGFAGGSGGGGPCPSPGATGRGAVTGAVTVSGNGTLTVHDTRCNTDVKVTYDGSSTLTKVSPAQAADLKSGENVTVVGQRQADGSVTATTISIQPGRGA